MADTSIVIDSSALLELILPGPRFAELRPVVAGRTMNAPDLLGLEVLSVLRREVRLGRMAGDRASAGVTRLRSAPIRYWPTVPMIPRIWELRSNVSSYDASYVVLAELLSCPLVTVDERLQRASSLTVDILP